MTAIEADLGTGGTGTPSPANVRQLRASETKEFRFRRWLAIRDAIDQGEAPSTEDAVWFGQYGQTSECRGMLQVFQDFGEAALK